MPQPVPANLHVDKYLTNVSLAYSQESRQFIADKVFPTVPVMKQSDKYAIFPKGYFYADEVQPRPLGGRNREASYVVQDGTYIAEEFGLAHNIDDRLRANADQPLDPDRSATRMLTTQMMIRRDKDWVAKFWATGVWATDITGVAATPGAGEILQWDQSGSDPIGDVDLYRDTVLEGTGYEPNKIVMGRKVWRVFKNHPDVVDRIKHTQRGVVTRELAANLLEIGEVLTPGSVSNEAAEGAAEDIKFIVPDDKMLLVYANPAPGIEEPSGGYTFAWTGLIPGETNAFGGVIERGREDRAHSDYVEIRAAWDQKQTGADLGVFFDTVVG